MNHYVQHTSSKRLEQKMKTSTYVTVILAIFNVGLRDVAFAAISPQQRADAQGNLNSINQAQPQPLLSGNNVDDTRQLQPPLLDQPARQLAQPQQQPAVTPKVPLAENAFQQQHYQQQQQQQNQPQFEQHQYVQPASGLHIDTKNHQVQQQQMQIPSSGNAVATSDVVVQIGSQLLSENKECVDDIRRLCLHGNRHTQQAQINLRNDIEVLQCLLDSDIDLENNVALNCQHELWSSLKTLTADDRFHQVAQTECAQDMSAPNSQLSECRTMHNERGHLLSCLIENKAHVQSENCKKFITEVEAFVFSDYRLIHDFADACKNEISEYKCGRIEKDDQATHSQGATLECLEEKIEIFNELGDKVRTEPDKYGAEFGALPAFSDKCVAQINRAVEYQSEDYHLDRPLYFACKNDREQFCSKVEAGDGKVLNCLLLHINEQTMSKLCHDKLLHRRQLIERDFKADHALIKMCAKELKQYRCDLNPQSVASTHNHALLPVSHIVLCLENAVRGGHAVDGQCQAVVLDQRKILMQHFNMTPEIGVHCAQEVTHCQKNIQKPEDMLHCLMSVVETQQGSQQHFSGNHQPCLRALQDLVTVANPMQDIRIDRVLQQACMPVLNSACKQIPEGSSQVITCLVDSIKSPQMVPECQKRLFELIWFAVRDFRLTGPLFEKCHKEAVELCHAPSDWNSEAGKADVERGPIVFTCLYRHAYHIEDTAHIGGLSTECASEVRSELERRSRDINLMPEIMGSCASDMGKHCIPQQQHQQHHDGEGLMMCLQRNLHDLEPECKRAVTAITQIQFQAPHLNQDLQRHCGPEMQKLCSGALGSDEQVLDCLIQAKTSPDMTPQCSQQVTQMQLVQLVNIQFSPQFWMACQEDIGQHCHSYKEKPEMLVCLHGVAMRSIETKSPLLTQRCAHRVNVEMFRQSENVQLDPKLNEACTDDERKLCAHVQPGDGRMSECLRQNFARLSSVCQQTLFAREQSQTQNRQIDYSLMSACKAVIRDHCAGAGGAQNGQQANNDEMWSCIKQAKTAGVIKDEHCTKIVLQRQIEENRDYRLNMALTKSCDKDITKFCHVEFEDVDRAHHAQLSNDADDDRARGGNDDRNNLNRASATHEAQEQLEGKVLHCLKAKLRHHQKGLSKECANVIQEVRREEAEDYRLDAYLAARCESDITSLCGHEPVGDVYECLKRSLHKNRIRSEPCKKEMARIIREGRVDVHVDTHLASTCSQDLVRFCHSIPQGDGRKMQCLLTILASDDAAMQLDEDCAQLLKDRQELFDVVNKLGPDADDDGKELSSVGELVHTVRRSRASNYLMTVLFVFIAVIFVGGLFCGRVSKGYAYRELKNR